MTREGQLASVELLNLENESVSSPAGENGHRVAVVVPVHNRKALTERFLKSFAEVEYENYKIVIVDDGSSDGTAEWLAEEHSGVVVLPGSGDLWWTGATNLGAQYALDHNFDFILTINNDATVSPDFLGRLVQSAVEYPKAIVGCRLHDLLQPDRIWALGGAVRWSDGKPFHINKPDMIDPNEQRVAVGILPGCGVLIPCDCFREIGLYDAKNYPHYHADSEFTFRAGLAGYKVLVDTQAIAWYDTANSFKERSLLSSFFGKRSPAYWRPILAFHLSYCPWYLIVPSMVRFYMGQNRFVGLLTYSKAASEGS